MESYRWIGLLGFHARARRSQHLTAAADTFANLYRLYCNMIASIMKTVTR
jgi:hypothetical protein